MELQLPDLEFGLSDNPDEGVGLLGHFTNDLFLDRAQRSKVLLFRHNRHVDLVLKLSDGLLQVHNLGPTGVKHLLVLPNTLPIPLHENWRSWFQGLDSGNLLSDDVDAFDSLDNLVSKSTDDSPLDDGSLSLLLGNHLVGHHSMDVLLDSGNSSLRSFVKSLQIGDSLDDSWFLLFRNAIENDLELSDLLLRDLGSPVVTDDSFLQSFDHSTFLG